MCALAERVGQHFHTWKAGAGNRPGFQTRTNAIQPEPAIEYARLAEDEQICP